MRLDEQGRELGGRLAGREARWASWSTLESLTAMVVLPCCCLSSYCNGAMMNLYGYLVFKFVVPTESFHQAKKNGIHYAADG